MEILLTALVVAFAAFCVWLTVRIINRRERWAKWTLAALAVVLVGYPLSFGPWLFAWRIWGDIWSSDQMTAYGFFAPLDTGAGRFPRFGNLYIDYMKWWVMMGDKLNGRPHPWFI